MYYLTNTPTGTTMEARETIPGVSQAVPDELVRHVFMMLGSRRACRVVDGGIDVSSEPAPTPESRFDWDTQQWIAPTP